MPEPFSCKIGDEDVNAVNARNLHSSLGSRDGFAHWIQDQIGRARLVEHRDYEVLGNLPQNPQGGRPSKEYALSLDAAKHVAMMAGTDKGFEVRDYFIKCEKKLSHVINTYLNETSNRLPDSRQSLTGGIARHNQQHPLAGSNRPWRSYGQEPSRTHQVLPHP